MMNLGETAARFGSIGISLTTAGAQSLRQELVLCQGPVKMKFRITISNSNFNIPFQTVSDQIAGKECCYSSPPPGMFCK
jgi:hypothetical protein